VRNAHTEKAENTRGMTVIASPPKGTPRRGGPPGTRQRAGFGFALALWQPSLADPLGDPLVFPPERRVV